MTSTTGVAYLDGCPRCLQRHNPPTDTEPAAMLPNIRPNWKRDGLAATGAVYYFQRSNGDVKIGCSANLPSRRTRLTQQHGPLTLAALEPGYFELEQLRHAQFSHLRVDPRAEWFRLGDDLLDHILYLLAMR